MSSETKPEPVQNWVMNAKEGVMVLPRTVIDPLCQTRFMREAEPVRAAILSRAEFIERSKAEQDFRYKQIIPYIVLQYRDKFLLIRRTPKQGEKRLHDKYSLGIGGHINTIDKAEGDILETGMRRELNEEIQVHREGECRLVGVINDDTTEVDRVHLGLVYLLTCKTPGFTNLEPEAYTALWQTPDEIAAVYANMESWAKIVYERIIRNKPA
jgi:predicted NUDIX family phosphoesterase